MKFLSLLLVATSGLSQLADAAPTAAANSTTLVYSKELTINNVPGIYEVFNDASLPMMSVSNTRLKTRCGSNNIHCDFANNRADAGICGHLMDILGDPSKSGLSLSPFTNQCFTATNIASNNVCCIAWSQQVSINFAVFVPL
jgi:hypothetical protein